MSGAAHAPGPWRIEKHDNYMSDSEAPIAVIDANDETVCCNTTFYPTALDPRNAPLIAAAPDHALICRAVCAGIARWETWAVGGELCTGGMRYSTKLDEFGCPVITDTIRAAIAEATVRHT